MNLLRQVTPTNMGDFVFDGSCLFVVPYTDNQPFDTRRKESRKISKLDAAFSFTSYASSGARRHTSFLSSSVATALALIDTILSAPSTSLIPTGHTQLSLLADLLTALPCVDTAQLATLACTCATRLVQQVLPHVSALFSETSSEVADAVVKVVDLYERCDRAHAYLRTLSVANWSSTSILPTHVQVRSSFTSAQFCLAAQV